MKILKIFLSVVCILVVIININSMAVTSDSYKVVRTADLSTADAYKDIIYNEEYGSRYSGRIWTDKSVYAHDNTESANKIEIDGKEVEYTDDFLTSFSVLGSSQELYGEESLPLDVVILLDISTSMTNGPDGSGDAAEIVIEQANRLIKSLMNEDESTYNISENNRIGVVVYAGGSQVILPLNHYSLEDEAEDYLTIKKTSGNGKYWSQITTHAKIDGDGFENITSDLMYADSTYLQGALYQGMKLLATENETTYTNPTTKIKVNRIPAMIVLTDGGTNVVGATSTSKNETSINFWDPLSWVSENENKAILPTASTDTSYKRYCPQPNGNPFYCSTVAKNSIPPRTLNVLLTAGYMKNWVEDNYNSKNTSKQKVNLLSYGIGLNVDKLTTNDTIQLNSTMNPREYFVENSANEQIKKAYELFQDYLSNDGTDPTYEFDEKYKYLEEEMKANWTFTHPTDPNEAKYDVKSVEDLYYIDEYMEADTSNITEIFDRTFKSITKDVFSPIGDGENKINSSNVLSYSDPIGEYLEVKDVSKLLLFGEEYNIIKDGEKTTEEVDGKTVEKQYYKPVGADNKDLVITNQSYNEVKQFKLSDIKIWVESIKSEESSSCNNTLYIDIPNNAIPIKLDIIELDKDR